MGVVQLANGDELIRTEDGNFHIKYNGNTQPLLIEREEGESLLIETVEQMKLAIGAFVDESKKWQDLSEKYAAALIEISEVDHGDLEQTKIALNALEEDGEQLLTNNISFRSEET